MVSGALARRPGWSPVTLSSCASSWHVELLVAPRYGQTVLFLLALEADRGELQTDVDAVVEAEPETGYHPVYGREGMCGARDPKEIGMHSLRGGTVAGVHEVSFFGQDEEVTLSHRATSRQIFVNGALAAAQKLVVRDPGFYTFDQVMFA